MPSAARHPSPPVCLTIAGSDSGGGAGIQADLKAFAACGAHGTSAITAITAQNTLGVTGVHAIPADMVIAQIDAVAADIGVDAVKIGMIGSAEIVERVADRLGQPDLAGVPLVFDPVMIATSGSILADAPTIAAFEKLMRVASVVTPNLPELDALGGEDAVLAHGCHLLAKGGHADGYYITDRVLAPNGREITRLEGKRFDTDDTHGTGCTLASALATGLGAGMSIEEAFQQAVRFVRIAILAAPGLGQGHGPIGHTLGHNPYEQLEG